MQEIQVWSLGREDPLEKEMGSHPSILAWRILWTEEPGRLQSMGSCESDTAWCRHHHHKACPERVALVEWAASMPDAFFALLFWDSSPGMMHSLTVPGGWEARGHCPASPYCDTSEYHTSWCGPKGPWLMPCFLRERSMWKTGQTLKLYFGFFMPWRKEASPHQSFLLLFGASEILILVAEGKMLHN